MVNLGMPNQQRTDGRARVARVAFTLATLLTITGVTFVALTETVLGLLEAMASFRPSGAFGFAVAIYPQGIVLFLVMGFLAGVWVSRRVYMRPSLPSLGRAISWTLLMIIVIVGGFLALLSLALPRNDRPSLAAGLYGMAPDVNNAFAARLRGRFPAGSSESILVDELRAEKFAINADRLSAVFDGDGFPCRNIWYVHWQAAEGTIVTISGSQPEMRACL